MKSMLNRLLVLIFLFPAAACAEGFSCSEWSNASLQHRGPISVFFSNDELIWSNGKNIYKADLAIQTIAYATFVDDASVYMVYGFRDHESIGLVEPDIFIRRIYNTQGPLRVSELSCR